MRKCNMLSLLHLALPRSEQVCRQRAIDQHFITGASCQLRCRLTDASARSKDVAADDGQRAPETRLQRLRQHSYFCTSKSKHKLRTCFTARSITHGRCTCGRWWLRHLHNVCIIYVCIYYMYILILYICIYLYHMCV